MAKSREVRPWKSISIPPNTYDMLESALLQLADREPKWDKQIRAFAKSSDLQRVIEHIDVMRNARRETQLEMPS